MKGLVSWFAENGVASNLLMILIIAAGVLTLGNVQERIFPSISPALITVTTVFPGESAELVEQGVSIKIEEAVYGLEGVRRVTSRSIEGVSFVSIEVESGADKRHVLDQIKTEIDAIQTFPEEAEEPVVNDVTIPDMVMSLMISGKTDEMTLQRFAEKIRDDLARLDGVTRVKLVNKRKYEISIEVSDETLRRFGLSLASVAEKIRTSSLDLSGGAIDTVGGEILLRSDAQAYVREDFENIVVLQEPDGTRVLLGDIAQVIDGFEDAKQIGELDSDPVKIISILRVGEQNLPDIVSAVKQYVKETQSGRGSMTLPEGISLTIWKDWSKMYESRVDLMVRTGVVGLILVFIVLALFMKLRLAFWVSVGIPTAFLGALWLVPSLGVTVNMLSLFAFIVALGIVVDDAIVVSENIHFHHERGETGLVAAKKGAHEVMVPVILAILTTIAAFLPMMTMPGVMGQFASEIPKVVVLCLFFSLVESLLILPSHLSHMKPPSQSRRSWSVLKPWEQLQGRFSQAVQWTIERVYRPSLHFAMRWRYLTLATGVAVLLLVGAMLKAQFVKFVFLAPIEGDNVTAIISMPDGTPLEATQRAVRQIERAADTLQREIDAGRETSVFNHRLTTIGSQPTNIEQSWKTGDTVSLIGEHLGEVNIELLAAEERNITSLEVLKRWRELTGPVPDALELVFDSNVMAVGKPIDVELTSDNLESLRAAADALRAKLAQYPGVYDISDSMRPGKQEVEIELNQSGEALGLSRAELALQVRHGFYGEEAQRIQRGRDDVKVMVRYPKSERTSFSDLNNMRVRTKEGAQVPFSQVASYSVSQAPATIDRSAQTRSVRVSAEVNLDLAIPGEILEDLEKNYFADFRKQHAGVSYSFQGEQREQAESVGGLIRGAIFAMLLIFSILAVAFRSFTQPLIVMFAIPFGIAGAVLAHLFVGIDVTLLSTIGMLAMTGVVVNDSMIMIDFINRARKQGMSLLDAVREAGPRRFRAIVITSLTTFAGLTPILLERSVQAQVLIPMAVSLAFGVLFATVITLVIIPATYLVLHDVSDWVLKQKQKLGS